MHAQFACHALNGGVLSRLQEGRLSGQASWNPHSQGADPPDHNSDSSLRLLIHGDVAHLFSRRRIFVLLRAAAGATATACRTVAGDGAVCAKA